MSAGPLVLSRIPVAPSIDDSLGDAFRVTVVAAGFDRWAGREIAAGGISLDEEDDELDLTLDAPSPRRTVTFDSDDDLSDIPSFLRR